MDNGASDYLRSDPVMGRINLTGTRNRWAVKWRSYTRRDGKDEHLMWAHGTTPLLFKTRKEARNWISTHYGYIRRRADLRAEPHGWKMPVVVKVRVSWRIVE